METCINFEDERRNLFLDTKSNDTAGKSTKKFDTAEFTGVCNKAVMESWNEYQSVGEIPLIKIIMLLKSPYISYPKSCQISRARWQGPAAGAVCCFNGLKLRADVKRPIHSQLN
jgi:hypothetical protein